jgi:hypothetical protein
LPACNHLRDFSVIVIGIMMKKGKLFRAGASGELDSIVSAGVPPTATRWIFNCVILRVSNNDIRVPKETDYFLVFNTRVFQALR